MLIKLKASTAIIKNNNKVLLLKRSGSVKTYKGYWQLPEGMPKRTEPPKQALIREIEEELGYKAESVKILFQIPSLKRLFGIPVFTIIRTVYQVSNPRKIRLSHEHADYKWVELSDLRNNKKLVPGTQDIAEKLMQLDQDTVLE